jgi:hypothetical protein
MKSIKIVQILTALLLSVIVAPVFASVSGISPFIWAGGLMVANFLPGIPGGALAFAASLVDITKPAGNAGAGGGLNNEIIAFLENDVLTWPERGTDKITISSNFVLKPGKFMRVIYSTPETLEPMMKKVKGENIDIVAYEVGAKFFHPGLEAAILQFMAEHNSSQFHFILRNCAGNKMYYLGEKCNPLLMDEAEGKWGAKVIDGKGITFTFLGQQSYPPAIYTGSLTIEEASGSPSGSSA